MKYSIDTQTIVQSSTVSSIRIIEYFFTFFFHYFRHLSMLCFFITKSNAALRTLSLKILRNMSFATNNKAALLSSGKKECQPKAQKIHVFFTDEFLHTLKMVLESGAIDEKFIVLTIIWSLTANSYKNKHKMKCSTLYTKLSAIQKNETKLLQTPKSSELNYVIEVLDFILKN